MLVYHRIAETSAEEDPHRMSVSSKLFREQMRFLKDDGYQCIDLPSAVNRLGQRATFPRKSFVLTFDDGYRDIHTDVWPILDEVGFTATVFLVAQRVGKHSDWEGQSGLRSASLLSWAEIRELADCGLTFGSHTLTHPHLPSINADWAEREIRQSKKLIEDELGAEVSIVSYPYGASNERIQAIVADSGYGAACGVDRNGWGRFNLWRAMCFSDESPADLAVKFRRRAVL